ncbi:MAG: hypothetical protein IT577_05090 [Verrucomicrobiae bacterium]|nr:hypothetical protein [Verrucomicrobiae bacterium]
MKISVIAALALVPFLARAQQPTLYTLEAKFIQMPTNGVIEISSDAASAAKDAACLGPNVTVRLGGKTVIRTKGGSVDIDATFRGLDVLSTPKVVTMAGREAMVMIGAEPPEYFVPAKDGNYRLEKADEQPGTTMRCTMQPVAGAPRQVLLDLECRVVEMEGRQDLPGVKLPVGPPIMRKREVKTKVSVQLGDWLCVGGLGQSPGAGPAHDLLVLVRVTEGEPKP